MTHDYTRKGGIVHAEIMLPAHAPPEFADRSTLWNSVEQIEKARDSQLAREIEAALPRELSREQQLALVRAYVKDNFVDKGMCADFAIHDKGTGNPHVHIMLTVRPLKENGAWGAKCRKAYDLDENGQRIPDGKGGWKNHREDTTDWNDKGNVEIWRAAWAAYTNRALEAAGQPAMVDHRSYKRQGIDKIPSVHLGPAASQMEKRGIRTDKGEVNRQIAADNKLLKETDTKEIYDNNTTDCHSILVVEDNKELRTFLKNSLSGDYTVITASNGEEGLQSAIDNLPDLIISDVMMPVMDGLEMVKHIKENNSICHIPIIILSAKASLDDRIAGLEQGIDDYITKPFSATYLKTRIVTLLHQRKSLQEMYMAQLTESKNAIISGNLTPSQPQITPFDEQFMQKVMEFMEQQMDNSELTIDAFAEHLMMSRTIFYRKLKSIIGLTPVDFIREIRIKRAVQLIDSGEYNFSQIAYMTGFSDPKYFSKCFKKVMGVTPSEYKERK